MSPSLSCSCWDTNEHSGPWWLIRAPILLSIVVSDCSTRRCVSCWLGATPGGGQALSHIKCQGPCPSSPRRS